MNSELIVTIKYQVNSNLNPADDSWREVDAGFATFTGDILEVARQAAERKTEIKNRFGVDEVNYRQMVVNIAAFGAHPDFPDHEPERSWAVQRHTPYGQEVFSGMERMFEALMLRYM